MSDLISRQDAIEAVARALWHYPNECYKNLNVYEVAEALVSDAIKSLPSTTCEDCIWNVCNYNKIDWEGEDGYISRRDAIRWVKTECNPYGKPTLDFESGKRVIEHLEQMPSAEPKTGEWIQKDMYPDRFCSECNYAVWDSEAEEYNFCPNCGADMRGEKHE